MTETVKSLHYTKNILQTIPNNDKMEVVTQTNAVKSPTDNSTTEFRVLRVGGSIRIPKDSFDAWLRAA